MVGTGITARAAVPYGESYTYEYTVTPQSVGTWPYHDHSVPQTLIPGEPSIMDIGLELGLMRVIAITNENTPEADVEYILVMHDIYASDAPGLNQDFDCFNGKTFLGNTPTFATQVGQRVRWRVVTLGQ